MCGRYSEAQKAEVLAARFKLKRVPGNLPLRYNIAPSQDAPVIINQDGPRLENFHWGATLRKVPQNLGFIKTLYFNFFQFHFGGARP